MLRFIINYVKLLSKRNMKKIKNIILPLDIDTVLCFIINKGRRQTHGVSYNKSGIKNV